ncbi:MAG TPA: two-component regulator propeller domain-containing protein [Bacteroidales bacterium]|nr:two-component regulator propeller domain-containing protein [Bacteroidales bacterium]HSA43713.1 two-component regulator propeller domain-containing protein [Bacteroidales bacterium]
MKKYLICSLVMLLACAGSLTGQTFFKNFTNANSGLPDDNVTGVAIDQNNVKWFGTQSGVARYNDTNWVVYTTPHGVIDNYINCIAVDANNRVWVGTDFGVSRFDGQNWTSFTTGNGLINNTVTHIAADAQGHVWFATPSGLSRYDGTNFLSYNLSQGLPVFIYFDDAGTMWVGTIMGGLARNSGTGFSYITMANGLLDDNILTITADANGNIWAGSYYGISVLNAAGQVTGNHTVNDGLYSNFVADLTTDSQGKIWAGMFDIYILEGGLSRFDGSNWVSLTPADGLVNDMVIRVATDQSDNLWVATGGGVSCVIPGNLGLNDALESNAFTVSHNPASAQLSIITGKPGQHPIRIMDNVGRTIYKGNMSGEFTTATAGWAEGIYLVSCGAGVRKIAIYR